MTSVVYFIYKITPSSMKPNELLIEKPSVDSFGNPIIKKEEKKNEQKDLKLEVTTKEEHVRWDVSITNASNKSFFKSEMTVFGFPLSKKT